MEKRDIHDQDGNKIGEIELPSGTSEERWAEALAPYAPPTPPTLQQIIDAKLAASMRFGLQVIKEAASENIITGITQAGKTREVSDFLSDVERYLRSGSLYAAADKLGELAAGEIPEDIQTWVSAERLKAVESKINAYLGR